MTAVVVELEPGCWLAPWRSRSNAGAVVGEGVCIRARRALRHRPTPGARARHPGRCAGGGGDAMTTEATRLCRQRAKEAWEKKLKAEGGRRLTLMLRPDDAARLARLEVIYGNATAAIVAGLKKLEGEE